MKLRYAVAIALILFACASSLLASKKTDAVKNDLKQAAKHAKEAAAESKADFVRRFKALRVDLHMKARKLQREIRVAENSVRHAAGRKMMAFRNQEQVLEKKLDEIKEENEGRWASLKEGVEDAAAELKEAFDEIVKTLD